MTKKLFAIVIVTSAMLVAWAETWTDPETGYTWTYTISGETAEIDNDWVVAISPKPIGVVVIPSVLGGKPVTQIGARAFHNCSGLTSVTIPDGVTSIGQYAFFGCDGLTSVTIPDRVTNIGYGAFYGCCGVTNVTIPASVTGIEDFAFYGCDGLTSVTIPDSVTSIGGCAFSGCRGLMSVAIPNSVTNIGDGAFSSCGSMMSITIPQLVCTNGEMVSGIFGRINYSSVITNVIISEGVKSIGAYVFRYCHGLKSVTIPDSVTNIGNSAFWECSSLTNVTIPNSVINIGDDAFFGCTNLTSVTIRNGVKHIGRSVFYGCINLESVIVPDSVTAIGPNAFCGCDHLIDVTFGRGVSSIAAGSFAHCCALKHVIMPDGITYIGESAFWGCSGLVSVTIPRQVKNISDGAFEYCSSLRSVTIPDNVKGVGQWAFGNCSGLMDVTIGRGVTNIGSMAFANNSALKTVHMLCKSAPATGGGIYSATPTNLTTYVEKGSTGWMYRGLDWSYLPTKWPMYDGSMARQITIGVLVVLKVNGGTLVSDNKKILQEGKAVGGLPTPTREGYTFAGWWTKKSGGVKITTKTKVTKDVTYYAHWTVKKFKVAATANTKKGGAVSGAGTKTYGSKVTLKAAPKKGYVFVRWINTNDEDTPWPSALKCRQPSVAFKMGTGNVSVKAALAKASADLAPVLSVEPGDVWYVEDDPGREISVAADSLSYPAVTLSGAPAGIGLVRVPDTDDRYVLKVTDAAKMKPGVYTVKVMAKNRVGKSASKSVKIVTPNADAAIRNGLVAGLRTSTLDPYVVNGGMKVNMTLADLGVEVFQTNGWKLASVAGLPTGLSWNGTAVVGAASKAGVFTVTFTMKKTVKDSKTKKTKTFTSTASAIFKVAALLPGELSGVYNGLANANVRNAASGDNTPVMDGKSSVLKVTVATSGKITANVGGVTLSSSGFDSETDGVYAVMFKKTQKITSGKLKGGSKVWQAYLEIDTNLGWDAAQLSGWYSAYTVDKNGKAPMKPPVYLSAQRNAFGTSAGAKAVAAAAAGTRTFALKSVKGEEWAYDLEPGGKALSVVVKQNGVATLSGKIGSVKVSGSATLEVGETAATVRFFTSKFVIEVTSVVEDGEVAETFGKVWRR